MNQRAFDHILVIMFENQYRGYVMENEYFRNLAAQGIELTNSFGVMHPSQTNYIASISGELCNMSDDEPPPAPLKQNTIVDLIEASPLNLDWRAYMDSYVAGWTPWKPTKFTPIDSYPYVLKHNPFSSYENIQNNQARWQKIDNEAGFYRDLLNGTFPQYAWFTPNMWHDGHYLIGTKDNDLKGERAPVLVDQQADWLKSFFAGLNFPGPNSKLPPNTLVVVTFDEADFEADYDPPSTAKYYYDGPNQIYTVLLGDGIEPGQQHEGYNHYSLLKTVEKNFNLGNLAKNDRDANYFQFLWDRQFRWRETTISGLCNINTIQSVEYQNLLYLSYIDQDGELYYQTFDGEQMSDPVHLASNCGGQLAISANQDRLMLGFTDKDAQLQLNSYTLQSGWQEETLDVAANIYRLSLVALPNHPAFMLVYSDEHDEVYSLRCDGQTWQKTADKLVCRCGDTLQLAALGSNILLIYQLKDSNTLACLTYNTAEFNVVSVAESAYGGAYDDTTINTWSPCAFSLNSFSYGPSIITPDEPEPTSESYQASGKISCATLDGVIHLLHNNPGSEQLVTETFSIAGILTPKNPVSYNPKLQDTTSNGYGTMYEAGWSQQSPVGTVMRKPDSPMTLANYNNGLWLFYQAPEDKTLRMLRGGY